MKYGSVCSGIEAASVAWHGLGWQPQWFSEIEKFPCSVLAHRFPDVPNLGDMTKLLTNDTFRNTDIDCLVGGTPCQSFSVAGLRAGLGDERGNLALEYVRLLMCKQPRWFLWENVPGVLSSSNGADFAAILSAWTGRDIEPQKFGTAGIIQGEFYSIAWRVLDSRHFGVPQRRRRVFVVGHLGNDWRPSAAVLFERESLLRDFTKGGKKRKGTAAGVEGSINCESNGISGAVTRKWAKGTGGPAGDEHYNMVLQPVHAFKEIGGCEGGGKGYLGADELAFTLSRGQDQSIMQPLAFTQNQMGDVLTGEVMHSLGTNSNATGRNAPNVMQPIVLDDQGGSVMNVSQTGIVGTLRKETHGHEPIVMQPLIYDTTQVTSPQNGSNPQPGDPCHPLCKGGHVPLLIPPAYGLQANIIDRTHKSGGNGLGVKEEEEAPTLTKADRHAVCQPLAFQTSQSGTRLATTHATLDANNGPRRHNGVLQQQLIRRLTPLECERLQGFPDGWTNIPGASDSNRYAALGNSRTVNVMRWRGSRSDVVNEELKFLGL